jgi:stearoyl-CoA desaturase (delta-9 desaturase)
MQHPSRILKTVLNHFDSHLNVRPESVPAGKAGNAWKIPWPFVVLNLCVLFVFWVGISPVAVAVAAALYFIRMFGITGVYHRYFSHRTYKTSRWMQFLLAFLGNTSAQRGPLWWAAHHRHHHAFSDMPEDLHSPVQEGGFWNSHILWWGRLRNVPPRLDLIKDFSKYPELMILDRFDAIAPFTLGAFTFFLGMALERWVPILGTSGPQMLIWGFFVSTAVLFHGVATINSLAHVFGSRRFQTGDVSRNNFFLALVTLGEGWHNNHHHYPNSVRQGFYWWEIDISFYALKGLSVLGLVWDLKPVPERILEEGRAKKLVTPLPRLRGALELAAVAVKPPDLTIFNGAKVGSVRVS